MIFFSFLLEMLGCGLAIIGVRSPSGGRGVAGAVWVSHASTIIILLCFAKFMIYLLPSGFLLDHDFLCPEISHSHSLLLHI